VIVELGFVTGTLATVIGADATVLKTGGVTLLETGTVLEDAGAVLLVVLPAGFAMTALTLLTFGELAVAAAPETVARAGLDGAVGGGIVIIPLALGAALATSETSCELLDTGIAPDRLGETAPRVPPAKLRRLPTAAPETAIEVTVAGRPALKELTVPVAEPSRLLTAVGAAAGAIPGTETALPAKASGSPVLFKPAAGPLIAVPKMPPWLKTCAI
jgi:hypothetical protein